MQLYFQDEFIPSLSDAETTSFKNHVESIFFNGNRDICLSAYDTEQDDNVFGAFRLLDLTVI